MKFKQWGVNLILLACCVMGAQAQSVGILKSVQGNVGLNQPSAVRSVYAGDGVQTADRIVTGSGSSATLTLKDGSVVSVGPNSTLMLMDVKFDTTTQEGSLILNLVQGSIRMVTGWLGKVHPDQVKVITPTSVVGVRGTDFIVEVP